MIIEKRALELFIFFPGSFWKMFSTGFLNENFLKLCLDGRKLFLRFLEGLSLPNIKNFFFFKSNSEIKLFYSYLKIERNFCKILKSLMEEPAIVRKTDTLWFICFDIVYQRSFYGKTDENLFTLKWNCVDVTFWWIFDGNFPHYLQLSIVNHK